MHFIRWPLILATFLAPCLIAGGQEFLGKTLVTPRLVAETKAIVPGKPFTVGVHLKMAPGWHTYWRFGGDSGAPTKIDWELPAGFQAGPIQWPLPIAHLDEPDLLTFIYENEVMLLVEITPPATLATEEVKLRAKLQWLVCEKTCIPGDGEVALTLPVSEQARPANVELFAQWRAQLPKVSGAPFEVTWDIKKDAVTVRLTGLPKEFRADLFPIPPTPDVKPGHPKTSEPAADGTRTITFPVEGDEPGLAWEGVLVTQQGEAPREGWSIASGANTQKPADAPRASVGASQTRLLGVLWAAFAGGLILNLMPCVLPVIALKIFGFVQQAGENPRRVFHLGLAFVAGVFTFFLSLAALVVAFQATGSGLTWGFQFQNSYILTILVALVFVFALSMFGVFEVVLGSGTATALDSLSRKEGLSGAFTHGLFTTLLGTSCTAPLLGSALGFAFVQPAPIVFLIFAVIAAGMSLPYFLLTWKPAWMRLLPKPGAWMERLKQFMGFVLLAVVVWLLGVLGETRDLDAVVAVSSFLLVVAVGCWVFGFAQTSHRLAAPSHPRCGRVAWLRSWAIRCAGPCIQRGLGRWLEKPGRGNSMAGIHARASERSAGPRGCSVHRFHRELVPELQIQRALCPRDRSGARSVSAKEDRPAQSGLVQQGSRDHRDAEKVWEDRSACVRALPRWRFHGTDRFSGDSHAVIAPGSIRAAEVVSCGFLRSVAVSA